MADYDKLDGWSINPPVTVPSSDEEDDVEVNILPLKSESDFDHDDDDVDGEGSEANNIGEL